MGFYFWVSNLRFYETNFTVRKIIVNRKISADFNILFSIHEQDVNVHYYSDSALSNLEFSMNLNVLRPFCGNKLAG